MDLVYKKEDEGSVKLEGVAGSVQGLIGNAGPDLRRSVRVGGVDERIHDTNISLKSRERVQKGKQRTNREKRQYCQRCRLKVNC